VRLAGTLLNQVQGATTQINEVLSKYMDKDSLSAGTFMTAVDALRTYSNNETGFRTWNNAEFIPSPATEKVELEVMAYVHKYFVPLTVAPKAVRKYVDNRLAPGTYYNLMYAKRGKFKGRIIFPIRQNGQIITWTSRSISSGRSRYISLSDTDDSAGVKAPVNIKDVYYNPLGAVLNGTRVLLVEGPFDALRLAKHVTSHRTWDQNWTVSGKKNRILPLAIFGTGLSSAQRRLLYSYRNTLEDLIILLDSDAYPQALKLSQELAHLDAKVWTLPKGVDDPGNMTYEQFCEML
jgi:hypothetical protein